MRIWICILFTLFLPSLDACFPVTHVYLCQQWMDRHAHYDDEQKRDCILGTLFPDIRHLGVIARELTHEADMTLEKVNAAESPFEAGLRIHALVDGFEKNLVRQLKAKELFKEVPEEDLGSFIKIVEDQVLYSRVNTQEVIAYLDTVVDGERQFGIHSTFIYTWHALLQRYLEGPPSDWIHHLARTHQHFHYAGRRTVAAWDQVLVETAAREEVRQFVQQLVEQFSQLLGSATPAQATSI